MRREDQLDNMESLYQYELKTSVQEKGGEKGRGEGGKLVLYHYLEGP